MSCDFCHKVTKFPAIIRREEVGITNKLCLDCFDKTPPSSLVPENEKNTKEPDFEEHEDNRNNTTCEFVENPTVNCQASRNTSR